MRRDRAYMYLDPVSNWPLV